MEITTVKSFDGRVKSNIALRDFAHVLKIDQNADYKKAWTEMTPVQKLLHILTLGLWRPGLGNTEKTEIHNLVTSLLIELKNHQSELLAGRTVKLHIRDDEVNCVIQGSEYYLYDDADTKNSYSLLREEVDTIRRSTQLFDGIDFYETDRKIPLPFLEEDKSILEIGESAIKQALMDIHQAMVDIDLLDFEGLLPGCELQDESLRGVVTLQNRDVKSVFGDVVRDFDVRLRIDGINVPGKIIADLLRNFEGGTEKKVLPEKIPTTISRELAEKVLNLNGVLLNKCDREKVISTLSSPGTFEMILACRSQGAIMDSHAGLVRAAYPYWWEGKGAHILSDKAMQRGYSQAWSSVCLYSIENHDGECRVYTRHIDFIAMTLHDRIYPCCGISQFELGPRKGAVKQTVSTVNGDEDFLGIGLQQRDFRYVLFKTSEEYKIA